MTDRDASAAVIKAKKALEDCDGWPIVQRWHIVTRTFRVLEGNARELQNFMEQERVRGLAAVENSLIPVLKQEETEAGSVEFDRLFHNFIAACSSVIERMRRVRNGYPDDAFAVPYQAKVTELFGVGPNKRLFAQLRNYLLHFGLPETATSWSYTTSGFVVDPHLLRIEKLLEWERWTVQEREYLSGLGDHLDLSVLATEYMDRSQLMFRWFHDQKLVLHPEQINEYRQLKADLDEALAARSSREPEA